MFHVEHMKISFLISLIFCLSLVACKKVDENPHLSDPFYNYYGTRLIEAKNTLATLEKDLLDKELALKDVVPQTGAHKPAQARFFASQNELAKIKQEIAYLEILQKERMIEAKKEYLAAVKSGTEWDTQGRYLQFLREEKLRHSIKRKTAHKAAEEPNSQATAQPAEH